MAVLQVFLGVQKKAVIERDSDLLTPDEVREHKAEIETAMVKELATWKQFGCFSRRPRRGAINVIDSRWVLKWRIEVKPNVTLEDRSREVIDKEREEGEEEDHTYRRASIKIKDP